MLGHDSLTSPPPEHRLDVYSADGTRLNVEIHGPDQAPTVVLVHGWTCSVVFWNRQINALLADGLRVVVYDQRGHGASAEPGPAGYAIEALADDLDAVLHATLEPDQRAVLAGHSMGAMTLIAFGHRHPEQLRHRVAAAVIASTGMHELVSRNRIVPMPLPLAKLARPMSTWLMGLSPVGAASSPLQRGVIRYATLSRSATEVDVEFSAWIITACPPATRSGFARMLSGLDLDRQVARFDVPTIVVAGSRDRLTPIWHARRLAARLPRLLELVEVPGAGHMTPIQSAGPVNTAVRRLVADYLGEPGPEPGSGPGRVRSARSSGSIGLLPPETQTKPDTQETA